MLNKCDRSKINLPFHQEREPWFHKLHVFLEVQGIPEAEEARGYAQTTTTKTERLEGWVTDAGDAGLRKLRGKERHFQEYG